MTTLNPEAQSIAAAFEKYSSVTPGQAQNLSASIEASSALAEKSNSAVLSRRRCLSLLLGTVVLSINASPSFHAALSPTKETSSMSRSVDADRNGSNATTIHPKLNAEQALTRLLGLIRNSRSLQDFTPKRLQDLMGTAISYANNGDDRYGFGELITSQWSYGFGVDRSLKNGPRFEFSFNETVPGASFPMTGICQIDFERFKTELEAMGFSSESRYGLHGALSNFTFFRPNLYIEVYPEGEANDSIEKISHRCVKMVLIS